MSTFILVLYFIIDKILLEGKKSRCVLLYEIVFQGLLKKIAHGLDKVIIPSLILFKKYYKEMR